MLKYGEITELEIPDMGTAVFKKQMKYLKLKRSFAALMLFPITHSHFELQIFGLSLNLHNVYIQRYSHQSTRHDEPLTKKQTISSTVPGQETGLLGSKRSKTFSEAVISNQPTCRLKLGLSGKSCPVSETAARLRLQTANIGIQV